MKKYRLKINYSEITKDNFDFVRLIREQDGEIIAGMGLDTEKLIKLGWLTEIKEPLSCEEWVRENKIDLDKLEYGLGQVELIWEAALENQKLGVVDEECSLKIGQVVGRAKTMIVVKRGVYEDDNKFLEDLLEEMKVGIYDCNENERYGLYPDSEKHEKMPIDKQTLCLVFDAALKYAREIS